MSIPPPPQREPDQTIQPANVDPPASPERARPDHPSVGLRHPVPVVSVPADLKLKFISVLLHPDGGGVPVLIVLQLVPVVGVDPAPALRAHHTRVQVIDVGLTATPVTAVPVPVTSVTGVEGPSHGVLVTLIGIVLRTPDTVTEVCITVVVTSTRVVPG